MYASNAMKLFENALRLARCANDGEGNPHVYVRQQDGKTVAVSRIHLEEGVIIVEVEGEPTR